MPEDPLSGQGLGRGGSGLPQAAVEDHGGLAQGRGGVGHTGAQESAADLSPPLMTSQAVTLRGLVAAGLASK